MSILIKGLMRRKIVLTALTPHSMLLKVSRFAVSQKQCLERHMKSYPKGTSQKNVLSLPYRRTAD